ncbi:MAG: hypothetical protein Q4A98_07765 [Comamonadaceae bacterium]|nr:hypothetical protein [Comamonadaceae bacterium]
MPTAPIHILPFAAIDGMRDFFQATGERLHTPHLQALLPLLQPVRWLRGAAAGEWAEGDDGLAAHERAWVQAALASSPDADGVANADAHPALAALLAAQHGHAVQAGDGWAQVTPCHVHIATDSITLVDPALSPLPPEQLEALRHSLQTLWAEDGLSLHPGPAGSWLAQAPWLRGLALPSIDRVARQDVRLYAPALAHAPMRQLQRAQAEAQMLLHDHPVNDARSAQGLLPINTLWFSGAGHAPADAGDAAQAVARLERLHTHAALRAPALQGDFHGWAQEWQALDARVLAEVLRQVQSGQPCELVLCGPQHAVALAPARSGYLARLARRWRQWRGGADPVTALLAQL